MRAQRRPGLNPILGAQAGTALPYLYMVRDCGMKDAGRSVPSNVMAVSRSAQWVKFFSSGFPMGNDLFWKLNQPAAHVRPRLLCLCGTHVHANCSSVLAAVFGGCESLHSSL